MAQQQGSDRLTHIIGNAGGDPQYFDTSKGEVQKLSIAVTMKYGDGDDGETRWVNASIWNEDLQDFVDKNISKGTKVVAVGFLKTDREYKGVKQFDLKVTEIGFATMAKRSKGGGSKGRSTRKASDDEQPAESEELGW